MIWYPLKWCDSAGLPSVIIACLSEDASAISQYTKSLDLSIRISVEGVSQRDDDWGTADVLRKLADKIKGSFVLLSCDTFLDVAPSLPMDFYLKQDSLMSCVLYDEYASPLLESSRQSENDLFLGIEESTQSLLYYKFAGDIEGDTVNIKSSLLWKHPELDLWATLQDAHVYFCKYKVLEIVLNNPNISSIRFDLLPRLVKCQYASAAAKRLKLLDDDSKDKTENNRQHGDEFLFRSRPENFKVSCLIMPPDQTSMRINTLAAYSAIYKHLDCQIPTNVKIILAENS